MASSIEYDKVGKLGFGYMRLPRKGDEFDYEQINKMADAFLASGGTYFDAAYVYGGAEEAFRETVVKRHPRESFTIATKLPVGMINESRTAEDLFNTSLERLGVDYIDYYLLHGINSGGSKQAEENGAWDYITSLKEQGKVRHIGFSFHGPVNDLDEVLTKHPETEFVMLQLNYYDWERDGVHARELYEIAKRHNKPIVAMEPLLGGKLASEDSPIAELMKAKNPNASLASWGMRFIAPLENILTVTSGMSNIAQVEDNIKIYANMQPITDDEMAVIDEGVKALRAVPCIDCTSCEYCKECPAKIRIWLLISLFNDHLRHKTTTNLNGSYGWMTGGFGKAKDCTKCGICEKACPQNLPIIETIAKVSAICD